MNYSLIPGIPPSSSGIIHQIPFHTALQHAGGSSLYLRNSPFGYRDEPPAPFYYDYYLKKTTQRKKKKTSHHSVQTDYHFLPQSVKKSVLADKDFVLDCNFSFAASLKRKIRTDKLSSLHSPFLCIIPEYKQRGARPSLPKTLLLSIGTSPPLPSTTTTT